VWEGREAPEGAGAGMQSTVVYGGEGRNQKTSPTPIRSQKKKRSDVDYISLRLNLETIKGASLAKVKKRIKSESRYLRDSVLGGGGGGLLI